MASIYVLVFVITASMVGLFGFITNAFIAAVNFWDWVKGKALSSCDLILFTLGISNICLQSGMIASAFIGMIWREILYSGHVYETLAVIIMCSLCSCFWLTACLCIFYCMKITNFSHPLFIWFKMRIDTLVSWMLLASVMGSLVLGVPVYWDISTDFPGNITANLTANSSDGTSELSYTMAYKVTAGILGCVFPFLLGVLSTVSILASLYGHIQQIKQNTSGFSKPNLEAHYGAAKTVISLLLIYITLALAQLLPELSSESLVSSVCWFVSLCFSPAQSIVLILGNLKLKQVMKRIFCPVNN